MTSAHRPSGGSTQPWRPNLEADVRNHEPRPEGQTISGTALLVHFANFVKLPHTVFALPFAMLGVVYASHVTPVSFGDLVLVVLAFTSARFAAMGFGMRACAPRARDSVAEPRSSARRLRRYS